MKNKKTHKTLVKLTPRANVIKLFTLVSYECSFLARVFILGKPLKPSVMFVGKARRRPESGESEGCFTRVGFGLSRKLYTRLERLARDNALA